MNYMNASVSDRFNTHPDHAKEISLKIMNSSTGQQSPYSVLDVPTDVTASQLKEIWHKKIHPHHPDRGGQRKIFNHFQAAFLSITEDVKQRVLNGATKMSHAEFRTKVRSMNPSGASTPRTKEDVMRDRYTVNRELDDIKPVFTGGFNNNAFQRLWMEENRTHVRASNQNTVPVSRKASKLRYTHVAGDVSETNARHVSLNRAFTGAKNPKKVDSVTIKRLKSHKNITKEDKLSTADAHNGIAEYRSMQLGRNTERLNTDLNYQLQQTGNSAVDVLEDQIETWILPPKTDLAIVPRPLPNITHRGSTNRGSMHRNGPTITYASLYPSVPPPTSTSDSALTNSLLIALIQQRENQIKKHADRKLKKCKKKLKKQRKMIKRLKTRNHAV